MNKEEILAKSRNEGKDEGLIAAENQGRKIGIVAFCSVLIFIIVFNLFTAQPNFVPMALFWAFIAAETYPKYKFTSKSGYLVTMIASAVASIGNLTCHVLSVLR